jgi:hypothetical protein
MVVKDDDATESMPARFGRLADLYHRAAPRPHRACATAAAPPRSRAPPSEPPRPSHRPPRTVAAVTISPSFVGIAAAVYGTLHFVAPGTFLPGGAPFAALLIWLAAVCCADIAAWVRCARLPSSRVCLAPAACCCRGGSSVRRGPPQPRSHCRRAPVPRAAPQLRLPRVVGMLLGGLLLENVPNSPVAAFPPNWGSAMRAGGLATIYLRCGLVLEWHVRRGRGGAVGVGAPADAGAGLRGGGGGVARAPGAHRWRGRPPPRLGGRPRRPLPASWPPRAHKGRGRGCRWWRWPARRARRRRQRPRGWAQKLWKEAYRLMRGPELWLPCPASGERQACSRGLCFLHGPAKLSRWGPKCCRAHARLPAPLLGGGPWDGKRTTLSAGLL